MGHESATPADAAAQPHAQHAATSLNPFLGKRGFYNRFNRLVYFFTGPAQVGIGRPEAPYEPPADPRCPLCTLAMNEHRIDRSGERTQLHCPTAA